MKFALIYAYDPAVSSPSEGEVDDWMAFDKAVKDAGAFVHEAGFQPVGRARTVSVRDGEVKTEEGGIARSGDVISGYYVLDVTGIDAAAEWARRIPTATYGRVEVRPIVEFEA